MNLLEESSQAIRDLHALCIGMRTGNTPDATTVLGLQAELVRLHMELGLEMGRKFGAKESAYLGRKIEQAKQYQKARIELKMTGGDSSEASLLAVGAEYQREIDAAVEYESYRTLLKSLQNAFDYARSVASFVKTAESADR